MNIIKFPDRKTREQKNKNKPRINISSGPVSFTCMDCGTKSEFMLSNMIFRTIEFYCEKCGSFYKLSNPLLTDNTFTPKK